MLRRVVTMVVVTLALTQSAARAATPRSPRIANYRITASYDAQARRVTGQQVLTWRNTTPEAAPDLYFHLYLNAFANNRSSFVRAAGDAWVDWLRTHPDGWGYTTVKSIRIGGTDLSARMQFVHPDDANIDDRTVFRLPLDAPVQPGRTVDVEIDFVTQLPKVVARSGYAGPFAFVAQWFPKVGVYEDGAWNCHQYHLTSEFFADFGVYDVTLNVPRDSVVGASGALRDERDNADGTKALHFVAEDVHDFAWTVDPRFRVVEESADGTALRLLLQPNHVDQAGRYIDAARRAVGFYREWIGEYPYPQLTIVDPAPGGGGAGGMEYPMLITVGTTWWMPHTLRFPEDVTIHEFGHQYWYGLVASNEFEEAWLDEGINSFVEGRIMDSTYGPGSYIDLLGLRFDSVALRRLQYLRAPHHDPMSRLAYQFLDRSSYAAISYAKTTLVLDTLDAYLGNDKLRHALAAYFERGRFRHPRGRDFLDAVSDSVREDLSWYFDQVISDAAQLDYAVTRVEAEEAHGFAGVPVNGTQVGEQVTEQKPEARSYRNEVIVERLGSVRMPVDVQIVFDDGSSAHERWDGHDRWRRFEYSGTQRVEWAEVDPHRGIPLDVNLLNNSRMREGGTRGIVRLAGRWGLWFQNLLYVLTAL